MERFIVAEISKTWVRGNPLTPLPPICQSFEHVLNVNHKRGYRLVSFTLHRLQVTSDELNETIVAVFEKEEPHA